MFNWFKALARKLTLALSGACLLAGAYIIGLVHGDAVAQHRGPAPKQVMYKVDAKDMAHYRSMLDG